MFVGRKLEGGLCLLNATQSDGAAAITIFVPAEAKSRIRAALADAGYGTSYQAGLVALLDELLIREGREPLRLRR